MKLRELVGSGDRIMLFVLPFLIIGLGLNILYPQWFAVGGPPSWLRIISILLLVPGVVIWLWSVYLILTRVPKNQPITDGPFALMKHPLYTAVALLVLPWLGFLLNSWLGPLLGAALYLASRLFAPEEEKALSKTFGANWEAYRTRVLMPWL